MFVYNINILTIWEGEDMYDYNLYEQRDILCIDLQSFFANISCVTKSLNPRTTMLAVVADTKKQGSIVLDVTNPLENIGINKGSRLFELPHRNDIYIINPNLDKYAYYLNKIFNIIQKYVKDEQNIQFNETEIFVDLTGGKINQFANCRIFAKYLLNEIKLATKINCAIGIGSNMFLSKMALYHEALNNESLVAEWRINDITQRLWTIRELSNVWGINYRIERCLNNMGIFTMGELANYSQEKLIQSFGSIGKLLFLNANGHDYCRVYEQHAIAQHRIYSSKAFETERIYSDLKNALLEVVEDSVVQLRMRNLLVKTISFSMIYSSGEMVNKTYTLRESTNLTMDIFKVIWNFSEQLCDKHSKYRKINVSLSNFMPARSKELNAFFETFEKKLSFQESKGIERVIS